MKIALTLLTAWSIYSAAALFYFAPKELSIARREASNTADLACVQSRLADHKQFKAWIDKAIASAEQASK